MKSILKFIKKLVKLIKKLFQDDSSDVTVIINTRTNSFSEQKSNELSIEESDIKIEKITKRVWVNNGTEQKLIDKNLLEEYKNQGYTKGKLKK